MWDLGANTGLFSRLARDRGIHTVAWDIDYSAVEVNYLPVVRPLYDLLDEEKSISDKILKRAKCMGYGKDDTLPNDAAAELALTSCEKLLEEVTYLVEDPTPAAIDDCIGDFFSAVSRKTMHH